MVCVWFSKPFLLECLLFPGLPSFQIVLGRAEVPEPSAGCERSSGTVRQHQSQSAELRAVP